VTEADVRHAHEGKGVTAAHEQGTIRQAHEKDCGAVLSIFNHYAVHGFAAYADKPVRERYFTGLLKNAYAFYVVDSPEGVLGFGFVKPFLPFSAFATTGELSYFIMPEYVNQGFGSLLLYRLIRDSRTKGISMVVAHMASWNEEGIRFHRKHGFYDAGRLKKVGKKFGEPFDILLMQKAI
jgi:phosphinothricin acetyltransferase